MSPQIPRPTAALAAALLAAGTLTLAACDKKPGGKPPIPSTPTVPQPSATPPPSPASTPR